MRSTLIQNKQNGNHQLTKLHECIYAWQRYVNGKYEKETRIYRFGKDEMYDKVINNNYYRGKRGVCRHHYGSAQ